MTNVTLTGADTWTNPAWRLGIDYAAGESTLLFASIATGFKSGGFVPEVLPNGELNRYAPEHVLAYEAGVNLAATDGASLRAAAFYYLRARTSRGTPRDSVARFHLGNGARLERLDFLADTSERALRQSHGLMVNYLYDLEDIERNHEAYAQQHAIVAAGAITRLVRAPARDVVPVGD